MASHSLVRFCILVSLTAFACGCSTAQSTEDLHVEMEKLKADMPKEYAPTGDGVVDAGAKMFWGESDKVILKADDLNAKFRANQELQRLENAMKAGATEEEYYRQLPKADLQKIKAAAAANQALADGCKIDLEQAIKDGMKLAAEIKQKVDAAQGNLLAGGLEAVDTGRALGSAASQLDTRIELLQTGLDLSSAYSDKFKRMSEVADANIKALEAGPVVK